MRQLLLLLCTISLFRCGPEINSQKGTEQRSVRNFAAELIDNDFLKYADSTKIDSLEIELKNSFYFYSEDNYKITHIDAEELAEFSFDFFLPRLNKMLEKRGLSLTVETASDYEKTNDIIINGVEFNLYSKRELDDMTFWDTAPRNFFKRVNMILEERNMDEQFYLLYGSNDLQAILLTDKQFLIISDYFKENEKEKPYLS